MSGIIKRKKWKLNQAIQYQQWIEKNKDNFHITEIFINNGYCVEYKPLRKIL